MIITVARMSLKEDITIAAPQFIVLTKTNAPPEIPTYNYYLAQGSVGDNTQSNSGNQPAVNGDGKPKLYVEGHNWPRPMLVHGPFTIEGTVKSSNCTIVYVKVKVVDKSDEEKISSVAEGLNTESYNINRIDKEIKFRDLDVGETYDYVIEAKSDEHTENEELFRSSFVVVKSNLVVEGDALYKNRIVMLLQELTGFQCMEEDGIVSFYDINTAIISNTKFKDSFKLVKRVMDSKFTTTIKYKQGAADTSPVDFKEAYRQKTYSNGLPGAGSDSIIEFDHDKENKFLLINPEYDAVSPTKMKVFNYIVLAHELIHADRYSQGDAVRSDSDDNFQIRELYKYKKMVYEKHDSGSSIVQIYIIKRIDRTSELSTVGLAESEKYDITENTIRAEHYLVDADNSLWLRGVYESLALPIISKQTTEGYIKKYKDYYDSRLKAITSVPPGVEGHDI